MVYRPHLLRRRYHRGCLRLFPPCPVRLTEASDPAASGPQPQKSEKTDTATITMTGKIDRRRAEAFRRAALCTDFPSSSTRPAATSSWPTSSGCACTPAPTKFRSPMRLGLHASVRRRRRTLGLQLLTHRRALGFNIRAGWYPQAGDGRRPHCHPFRYPSALCRPKKTRRDRALSGLPCPPVFDTRRSCSSCVLF